MNFNPLTGLCFKCKRARAHSYWFISLLIICLLACRSHQKTNELLSENDTIMYGKKIWSFDTVGIKRYKSGDLLNTYSFEQNEFMEDEAVKRLGLSLCFELDNNDTLTLTNDTSDSDAYVQYIYCKKLGNLNHWLINGLYYEWNQVEIISCVNGKRTPIMGYPIFSPDGKYMFCGSFDESGEGTNGMEIWKLKGTSLQLTFRRTLNKWGPQHVAWIANDTLLIERYFMLNPQPGYVKMGLPNE